MGSLGERLDSKFITAYFFPAFAAVLGTFWILVAATGGERFAERLEQLDSVQQAIAVVLLLLTTAMIAHLLRALARPIAQLFAGRAFPTLIKNPAIQRQLRARARVPAGMVMVSRGERLYPHDPADTAPTAFGNVLATAADYARLVYGMESYHWWPRLLPLLPVEFQEMLRSMEAPMRGMLNLSLVALYLGGLATVALGLAASQWQTVIASVVVGVLLANFFYRAAIVQATELARNIWVGFDLYRFEIMRQMNVEVPTDLQEERALWQDLSQRLRNLEPLSATASSADDTAEGVANAEVRATAGGPG